MNKKLLQDCHKLPVEVFRTVHCATNIWKVDVSCKLSIKLYLRIKLFNRFLSSTSIHSSPGVTLSYVISIGSAYSIVYLNGELIAID